MSTPEVVPLAPFAGDQDFFPIVTWDRQEAWGKAGQSVAESLRQVAECHFTVAGFVRPEDVPLCEKLGLAAIVAPSDPSKPWFRDWKRLDKQAIDNGIAEMVKTSGNGEAVLGYAIMDEPGVAAFAKLAAAVAAVRKHAPGKLGHINLYPNYATLGASDTSQLGAPSYDEYLERFVAEVQPQFVCYDNYMVQYSDDLRDPHKAALYFSNLLAVRKVAARHGLPFWNVVCCNQIRKTTTIPSPANLAVQAYTSLAAGARGITWFKYNQGAYAYAPIDAAGRRTEAWQYLRTVNEQVRVLGPIMNRLTSTGVFFTAGQSKAGLPELPGRIVQQAPSKASLRDAAAGELPLMIGEFAAENGADYLMVVNLSLERSANIRLTTVKHYQTKQVFSAVDGRLSPLDEANGHWLPAGCGLLVKLEPAASSTAGQE
jgi:hypothetical protein